MNYKWYKPNEIPKSFYCKMFGVRKIAKELGGAIYFDNCDYWLLAIDNNGLLAAFSGITINKNKTAQLKRAYVFENYRMRGVYKKMLFMRIEFIKDYDLIAIKTLCNKNSEYLLKKIGFKEIDNNKINYKNLIYELR